MCELWGGNPSHNTAKAWYKLPSREISHLLPLSIERREFPPECPLPFWHLVVSSSLSPPLERQIVHLANRNLAPPDGWSCCDHICGYGSSLSPQRATFRASLPHSLSLPHASLPVGLTVRDYSRAALHIQAHLVVLAGSPEWAA